MFVIGVFQISDSTPVGVEFSVEFNQVREYNITRLEWEAESKWPQLGERGRRYQGCSLLSSLLVVAGGVDNENTVLDTTVTLDLALGRGAVWVEGGRMKTPRYDHAMVTVGAAGKQRIFVLGGGDGMYRPLDSVERWREDGRSWEEEEERLPEKKMKMGAVAVTEEMVCGP